MALNAAELENIEALKNWWSANGTFLVLLAVLVGGGFGGWTLYDNSRTATADAASALYQQVMVLTISDTGEPLPDVDTEAVSALVEQLQTEHATTTYAYYASLFAAQQAVRAADLQAAEAHLQWILDNQKGGLFSKVDEGLMLTVQLRLGRILLARGELERALTLVNSIDPQTFEAGFAELRGDIYAAMGRSMDAREAYIASLQAGSNSDLLLLKIDNLPPPPEESLAPAFDGALGQMPIGAASEMPIVEPVTPPVAAPAPAQSPEQSSDSVPNQESQETQEPNQPSEPSSVSEPDQTLEPSSEETP